LGIVGGSFEAFYLSFGENDFCSVDELTDHASASAVAFPGKVSRTFASRP
jgi:hypothetical protein